MAIVVLVNPFEVSAEKEEEFLKGWEAARDFMQKQKGYRGTRLHRSLTPTARFRFINVAEWETAADFQTALNHPDFVKLRDTIPFPHYPALYEVMHTWFEKP